MTSKIRLVLEMRLGIFLGLLMWTYDSINYWIPLVLVLAWVLLSWKFGSLNHIHKMIRNVGRTGSFFPMLSPGLQWFGQSFVKSTNKNISMWLVHDIWNHISWIIPMPAFIFRWRATATKATLIGYIVTLLFCY